MEGEGTYLSYGAEGYEAVDEQRDAVQIHTPRLVMTIAKGQWQWRHHRWNDSKRSQLRRALIEV